MGGAVKKIIEFPIKVVSKALSWIMPQPEIPEFGETDFDSFEKGILLNKQSNDANIPVVYGERLLGGTRVFLETSGTDNEFLYMALVLCEGEINSIEEITERCLYNFIVDEGLESASGTNGHYRAQHAEAEWLHKKCEEFQLWEDSIVLAASSSSLTLSAQKLDVFWRSIIYR